MYRPHPTSSVTRLSLWTARGLKSIPGTRPLKSQNNGLVIDAKKEPGRAERGGPAVGAGPVQEDHRLGFPLRRTRECAGAAHRGSTALSRVKPPTGTATAMLRCRTPLGGLPRSWSISCPGKPGRARKAHGHRGAGSIGYRRVFKTEVATVYAPAQAPGPCAAL